MITTQVADFSMYQCVYHGDPHNYDQLYDPAYWTVEIDWVQVAANVAGLMLRAGIGTRKDPCFDRLRAGAIAHGIAWGAYHAYNPFEDVGLQARLVWSWVAELPPLGVWADIEMGNAIIAVTLVYLAMLDHEFGLVTGIYSGGPYLDTHFTPAQQDALDERLLWIAGYPHYWPTYGWDKGANHALHQYTDQFALPGLPKPCDMSVPGPTWPYGSVSMSELIVTTGCYVAGHTQGNSDIIPIYADLVAAGAVPNGIIADEDGGKAIEAQKLGVRSRVTRLERPQSESDYEYGGGGRLGWPPPQVQYFVTSSVDMPYKRLGVAEIMAMTLVQAGYNEWGTESVESCLRDLDIFEMVIDQAAQRSAHDKARLMGISDELAATLPPIRYILPIFNAGTPKTWAQYVAISKHPIWAKMAAGGHVAGCHEGVRFDDPFDYLADGGPNDQGVRGHNTLEGAPYIPDAGLMNFRIDYLLYLLWQRGIKINYAILEWYDGRRPRGFDLEARVDNLIWLDQHLAHAGGPWRAYCLFYATFELTNDPTSPWYPQDFTLLWKHPRWRAYFISQAHRFNGGTRMPDVPQVTIDQFAANERNALAIAQANLALLAPYQHAHVWAADDVVLATVDPIKLYGSPSGSVVATRSNYTTTDQHVLAVSPDQKWLKVFANPEYWVSVADVKLKGT